MDVAAALKQHFGFAAFRPGQEDAVRAAIGPPARDVLVVMPTGAGKSLCYQLPALVRDDLTLVVSPLVSLMQDQVDALDTIAPGRVGLVNGQRSPSVNGATLGRAASGVLRLLYVAPERFSSRSFLEAIRRARVGLFVVDEAHCVSQWGHDFRPDYLRLAGAARWLRADAIVASTATATPAVARDVVRRLGLRDPLRVSTGFDRPNLSFAVVACATTTAKHRHIAAALAAHDATPAIVYAGTRAGAARLGARLSAELGAGVGVYHAGLAREQRAAVQRRFMDGDVGIVVATSAFGMGIDKADVRTVCHASVPGSLEAYYQEAGRAGRDGLPARALLFAEAGDKGLHAFFIQRGGLSGPAIAAVAQRLSASAVDGRYDVAACELAALLAARGAEADRVRSAVGHLVQAGVVRPAPSPPDRVRGRIEGPYDRRARALCRASVAEARRARWRQHRAVWAFVEGSGCRRRTILHHFGDASAPATGPGAPCCDACDPRWVPAAPPASRARAPAFAEREHRRAAGEPGRGGGDGCHPDAPDLDAAVLRVVASASPPVGRARTVEILRGARARALARHGYDGLADYATFDHLSAVDVLARVDQLVEAGRLRSTGGASPTLELTGSPAHAGSPPQRSDSPPQRTGSPPPRADAPPPYADAPPPRASAPPPRADAPPQRARPPQHAPPRQHLTGPPQHAPPRQHPTGPPQHAGPRRHGRSPPAPEQVAA